MGNTVLRLVSRRVMPAYLDTVLDWILRGVVIAFGAGALIALARWVRAAMRERRERWAIRLALAMLALSLVYAWGHARLLWKAEELEAGRMAWRRYGDPREAERNRAELRGWIYDCTGEDANALARYGMREGEVQRLYPLGEAGANLIGGGTGAEDRDYTVERLFAKQLRAPRALRGAGRAAPPGHGPAADAVHGAHPRGVAAAHGYRAGRRRHRPGRADGGHRGLRGHGARAGPAVRHQALRAAGLRLQAGAGRALVGERHPRDADALPAVHPDGQRAHPQLREPRVRVHHHPHGDADGLVQHGRRADGAGDAPAAGPGGVPRRLHALRLRRLLQGLPSTSGRGVLEHGEPRVGRSG